MRGRARLRETLPSKRGFCADPRHSNGRNSAVLRMPSSGALPCPAISTRREFLEATTAGTATGILAAGARGRRHGSRLLKGPMTSSSSRSIGCGGRGTHDAGLFKNTPNVEVAYVCDVDEARRESAAKTLGVPAEQGRRRHAEGARRQVGRCRDRRHARSLALARRRSWPATPASTSTSKSRSRTTSAKAGCWSKRRSGTRRTCSTARKAAARR